MEEENTKMIIHLKMKKKIQNDKSFFKAFYSIFSMIQRRASKVSSWLVLVLFSICSIQFIEDEKWQT